jgi:hypothetical protein
MKIITILVIALITALCIGGVNMGGAAAAPDDPDAPDAPGAPNNPPTTTVVSSQLLQRSLRGCFVLSDSERSLIRSSEGWKKR